MSKPTDRLTGALLDSALLSIADEMHNVELEVGRQMSSVDFYAEASHLQHQYRILPNNNPATVLGLASDLKNLMPYVRDRRTKSIVASANSYLKGDMKAGEWQPAFTSTGPMKVENGDHTSLTEPEAGITSPAD